MLAHELRRRMAAVRVAGEAVALLRDQGRDITSMLDLLLAEVGDLDALASEVLGDRRARPAEATPDVAETAQAAARTVAVARGASVRVQAGAPAEVEASPTLLRQAIENLIDNAAAHDGGPDGIEVDVRPDQATGQVEVVVADRGAAAQDPGGHGLGLFLVRRFLEEAGGRSWVAPREGGGTLVGLRMPLRPA
jgi:signal transduction histidine kinase